MVGHIKIPLASLSEWSKEPDLRSGSVSCVGSNPTRCKFPYSVMVNIRPFQGLAPGSIPGMGNMPYWRNWIARTTSNREAAGSSPA